MFWEGGVVEGDSGVKGSEDVEGAGALDDLGDAGEDGWISWSVWGWVLSMVELIGW